MDIYSNSLMWVSGELQPDLVLFTGRFYSSSPLIYLVYVHLVSFGLVYMVVLVAWNKEFCQ